MAMVSWFTWLLGMAMNGTISELQQRCQLKIDSNVII